MYYTHTHTHTPTIETDLKSIIQLVIMCYWHCLKNLGYVADEI